MILVDLKRKRFVIVFNSISKSASIPSAMRIANGYQHVIQDGYCYVFFETWDSELHKLLLLVDGLKGTRLIERGTITKRYRQGYYRNRNTGTKDTTHPSKSIEQVKEQQNIEIESDVKQQRLKDQFHKRFKREFKDVKKDRLRLTKEVEIEKAACQRAKTEMHIRLFQLVLLGHIHVFFSVCPLFFVNESVSATMMITAISIALFIFAFFGIFFGLGCVVKYDSWIGASKSYHSAKEYLKKAQRELEAVLNPSSPEIPPDFLTPETLIELLQKGFRVKLEDVRAVMDIDQAAFDGLIVDMAIEHGFWIDGDELICDNDDHAPFMDKIKKIHERRQLLEKFSNAITSMERISIKDLKELTLLEARSLDEHVIDWAIQFGFKIDGDELVLDPAKVAGFIDVLQTFSP